MIINERGDSPAVCDRFFRGRDSVSGTRRIAVIAFRSFRVHAVSKNIMVKTAKSPTNVFHVADPRVAAEEQLER
jgi:hypothetical protein